MRATRPVVTARIARIPVYLPSRAATDIAPSLHFMELGVEIYSQGSKNRSLGLFLLCRTSCTETDGATGDVMFAIFLCICPLSLLFSCVSLSALMFSPLTPAWPLCHSLVLLVSLIVPCSLSHAFLQSADL